MTISIATLVVAFTPFMQPLPVWNLWPWLLVPLCFGVSLVYKSVRVESVRKIPVEAAKGAFWIILGMIAAAVGLVLLLRFLAD
jgi:hypothetical protein